MARYTKSSYRISRRLGFSTLETGEELARKPYAPGAHGNKKAKKLSNYGTQLQEKQKVRFMYGVNEKQFRKTFDEASKLPGKAGENFLKVLETRLDNVVYRIGFASTRAQARQLVRHGHFEVNGVKVNIPSYLTKVGEVVKVKESSANSEIFKQIVEATENGRPVPTWLEADLSNKTGKIVALPSRDEIDLPVQEHLIVELYSK